MPKYNVHSYSVVRIKVTGIEANSPEDAIASLEADPLTYLEAGRLIARHYPGEKIEAIELDDGAPAVGYLVDLIGDDTFENSKTFDVDKAGNLILIGKSTENSASNQV